VTIDRLFSAPAQAVLEKALRASGTAHEVIAHNLANVDTPGFKRSEVLFQERLAAALAALEGGDGTLRGARTDARHLPIGEPDALADVEPRVVVRAETSLRPDGNNVDLDAEMVRLQQNELLYESLAQVVRMKLTQLRSAINEGRR
jgi:flagellar basal-body rod protein FlgB